MASIFSWTKPYCGVQHLQQWVSGLRQITLTDYGDGYVQVVAIPLEGFTEIWKETADTVREAQKLAESFASQFDPRTHEK